MCQDNFLLRYTPNEIISLDESCVPFKGRVWFLQYSKAKPNKFHIKKFMVSEHQSGYICGFSVYTGERIKWIVIPKCNTWSWLYHNSQNRNGPTWKDKTFRQNTEQFSSITTLTLQRYWMNWDIATRMGVALFAGHHKGLPKAVSIQEDKAQKRWSSFPKGKDISSAWNG